MKKYEIFIFMSIIVLCFISFPHKVFGQEENCLEDFERWVQENKNNKEEIVYTLSCDMVSIKPRLHLRRLIGWKTILMEN